MIYLLYVIGPRRYTSLSKDDLDRWCLWNHICLAHLQYFCSSRHLDDLLTICYSYCVGTKRKSILDYQQISKCRRILDSDHATNFEIRMVAEVNLYWIVYESCSETSVDLQSTHSALHAWREEWKFLFGTNFTVIRCPLCPSFN